MHNDVESGTVEPEPDTEFDVFISHAYEDKRYLVRPLANRLQGLGVKVWYDEFEVDYGDDIGDQVDRGLRMSRYGVLVISEPFISKAWPNYERRGLLARTLQGKSKLLPIWRKMSVQTIADIYPALANTKAFRSPSQSVDQIASELTRIIRPDIYENFLRRQIFEQMVASAKPKVGTIAHLKPGKIGTGRLTAQQRVRAKLVNYILADVLPWPLERSLQAYSQDVYPVNELHKWERIAASYLDTIRGMVLSPEKRREIFLFILGASSNMLTNDVRRGFKHLSVPEMQEILTAMNNVVPREPAPEVALEQEESTHDEA